VVRDAQSFDLVEQYGARLVDSRMQHPAEVCRRIVSAAARAMLAELETNPFETDGYERPADFGHTFAHDLEAASDFLLPHGQAVAIDMAFSTIYANVAGACSSATADRIIGLLVATGLPLTHVRFTRELIWSALNSAALHRGGRPNWVIPVEVGRIDFVRERREIDPALVDRAFARLHERAADSQPVDGTGKLTDRGYGRPLAPEHPV
jgi:3-dehydroquinate synthase